MFLFLICRPIETFAFKQLSFTHLSYFFSDIITNSLYTKTHSFFYVVSIVLGQQFNKFIKIYSVVLQFLWRSLWKFVSVKKLVVEYCIIQQWCHRPKQCNLTPLISIVNVHSPSPSFMLYCSSVTAFADGDYTVPSVDSITYQETPFAATRRQLMWSHGCQNLCWSLCWPSLKQTISGITALPITAGQMTQLPTVISVLMG